MTHIESTPPELKYRMYAKLFPHEEDLMTDGEIVMGYITDVNALFVLVNLVEYGDISGTIRLSGFTPDRRLDKVPDTFKVGQYIVVRVLNRTPDMSSQDLSLTRISREDIDECTRRYANSKAVNRMLKSIASHKNIPLVDLYRSIVWPLSIKYGHAYNAFSTADDAVFDGLDISDEVRAELHKGCIVINPCLSYIYS
jgi:translation initiation factor 2 alpha subunit (eIF-2alpha)